MKRLSLICLAALAPACAMADIIPIGTTVTGEGPYVWSYHLRLAQEEDAGPGRAPASTPGAHLNLIFGSLFTIYDFDGYVAGTCSGPSNWRCTAQAVGFTPDDVLPADNGGFVNLTWIHTNGPVLSGNPNSHDLGAFSAQSIYHRATTVSYAGHGIKNMGSHARSVGDNVGLTQGPGSPLRELALTLAAPALPLPEPALPLAAPALPLPEPGSLALAGLGLVGLLLARRRRA